MDQNLWTTAPDGSVLDQTGKVILFSAQRFIDDICLGNCCFICGAQPGTKEFNNEHVLPLWLLRRYDLFARQITLPNGVGVRYDRYTVPCCKECNSLMGDEIETPISEVVKGGLRAINDFAANGNLLKLFVWANLIYLKTHLKDKAVRFHLDARNGTQNIADEYDWADLHHVHCIVRCFYNECLVEKSAVGSFFTAPAITTGPIEPFDYCDLYLAQSMLLRLDDAAMFFVFNDSGAAMNYFWQHVERITGHLSPIQCREIMTELAWLNLRLKNRPTFQTECDLEGERCRTFAVRPEAELLNLDLRLRGKLLRKALQDIPSGIEFQGCTREAAVAAIDAGTMTFLFDEDGKFIENSMVPKMT